ncbi:cytochrome P450 [Thioclava sp. F36-7]|uniref:cytochrome P450 n=1 Tax=Thioclava sp. F36-7 TaxID=1915317 RepID=UPI000995E089|nr:cytochrome P450 [Thioclava sp. F36-7]OOY09517.1 cytochrome [Thioclava sp. F36-7]
MQTLSQSPLDPDFVQNPYPFYDRVRQGGPFVQWPEYGFRVTARAAIVGAALRDRRLGREAPPEQAVDIPKHLEPFYAIERHSMLELEAPTHTRLRKLVTKAFTPRRIAGMQDEIATLCHRLIDDLPEGGCDLLEHFAKPLPVIVIARLLGVPESDADKLLAWSNAMVQMYQARRDISLEEDAAQASADFAAYLGDLIETRRKAPGEDLISELIAVEEEGTHLTRDELISTVILLLNAGHEATVHQIGNSVKTLIEQTVAPHWLEPARIDGTIEELLRFDPPLHLFTRWLYEDMEFQGQVLRKGERIGLLLAGANRDPSAWDDASVFDPSRPVRTNFGFGAGAHFCIGAPLARLELKLALPMLMERLQGLDLPRRPYYADLYHFHGLEKLQVTYTKR